MAKGFLLASIIFVKAILSGYRCLQYKPKSFAVVNQSLLTLFTTPHMGKGIASLDCQDWYRVACQSESRSLIFLLDSGVRVWRRPHELGHLQTGDVSIMMRDICILEKGLLVKVGVSPLLRVGNTPADVASHFNSFMFTIFPSSVRLFH